MSKKIKGTLVRKLTGGRASGSTSLNKKGNLDGEPILVYESNLIIYTNELLRIWQYKLIQSKALVCL